MTRFTEIPSANDDAWTIAEGELDGLPSMVRFRPRLEEFAGDPRYARRLVVSWSYEDENASGMPSEDESEGMTALEDCLVPGFEAAAAGVLAFVFTHDGTRDWHFYVSATADLREIVGEALADLPELPISLHVEDDAEWAEFREVLASVREV